MNKFLIIIFLFSLWILACKDQLTQKKIIRNHNQVSSTDKKPVFDSIQNREEKNKVNEQNNLRSNTDSIIILDTIALKKFWISFKNDLKNGNRKNVIDVLQFPIRAIHPVLFKFAHDCDTLDFSKNEKKYWNLNINYNDMDEYYDFVFSETLKEVIYQTEVRDLLEEGILNKKQEGLTYRFFPRNYNIKVECFNDHLLKFHFNRIKDEWKIKIGGL